ncbi:MAG: glycosyltransferase family 25 protein [Rhodobacteraceae bacterium]|nr:glycosyltransferase family 25 protein [Paracoccaceae bacterium]
MIHAAYIIHLERAPERAENVQMLVDTIPMSTAVHPAVDGSALTGGEVAAVYQSDSHQPHYPFPLTSGEIGCFLSHRSLWARIVADGLDAALIIEDDASIDHDPFASALALAREHIDSLGYIKLPIKNRHTPIHRIEALDGIQLFEQQVIALGCHCQMVSRAAAETLLAATKPFDRPVDVFQQLRHLTGQRIYTIYPNGISEISASLGGSNIRRASKPGFLAREFKRFAYRRTVRRLSAKTFP